MARRVLVLVLCLLGSSMNLAAGKCSDMTEPCSKDSDCCFNPLKCKGGQCVAYACGGFEHPCSKDTDCCERFDLKCVNSRCRPYQCAILFREEYYKGIGWEEVQHRETSKSHGGPVGSATVTPGCKLTLHIDDKENKEVVDDVAQLSIPNLKAVDCSCDGSTGISKCIRFKKPCSSLSSRPCCPKYGRRTVCASRRCVPEVCGIIFTDDGYGGKEMELPPVKGEFILKGEWYKNVSSAKITPGCQLKLMNTWIVLKTSITFIRDEASLNHPMYLGYRWNNYATSVECTCADSEKK